MRILVVMDEPGQINPRTDTTLVIIDEARRRGHTVETCSPGALWLDAGAAQTFAFLVEESAAALRTAVEGRACALELFDCVLMRKDPPFDLDYYFATLLLSRARTRVINRPRGLREANEKLYIFNFLDFVAPTRVTRSQAELRDFLSAMGGEMIVKPLDGCGGAGVFHVRRDDRNANSILEMISDGGKRLVMAQKYLPQVREGDKRILILDGEPIGAVLRVPRDDETRGNLHVGGTATQTTLSPREREICAALAPRLVEDGLWFVGIDVIGGWLTEVNVTSPTGVQEINRLDGVKLEERIVDWLEKPV
jgi:glutathione synthase